MKDKLFEGKEMEEVDQRALTEVKINCASSKKAQKWA